MTPKGRFPSGGSVLLVPLNDAQFEAALEAHELEVPATLVPDGALPPLLGIMRARHAGMLTHWAEIKAVDRGSGAGGKSVRVRLGPLNRFPRPIEWREQRELYRPLAVEAEALSKAGSLEDVVETGQDAAAAAIMQAAHFIELATPKLDLSRVSRGRSLEQAASFAAKDPAEAIAQIDAAITESLRDLVATFYGEPAQEDEARDGWFGQDKFQPSVEAYFELLREAEDKELEALLAAVERYLVVKGRALGVASGLKAQQVVELIAVAQSVLDSASGRRDER